MFYYLTLTNENVDNPSLPEGVEADIIRGLYCLEGESTAAVRLLGSGSMLAEVQAAAERLRDDWGVDAQVWSATSYTELEREARAVQRWNLQHPDQPARKAFVSACLDGEAPVIAVTDYQRALPQLVAAYVAAPFVALGTDGFGRSDTRSALRDFFEVDRRHIVCTVLATLAREGRVEAAVAMQARLQYGLDAEELPPWQR